MLRPIDFLETRWFALALLAAAAAFGVRVALRRPRPVSAGFAFSLGMLGLGGATLAGAAFNLFEYRVTAAELLAGAAVVGLVVAGFVLLFARVWSYWLGVALAGALLIGFGAWITKPASIGLADAGTSLRGLEFVRPEWLALLVFVPMVFYVSRRSLSGLGPTRKWVAISARALVIALLAMALAEPRLRRQSEHVTVLFVVDRSFSVPQDLDPSKPATEAADRRWNKVREFMENAVARRGTDRRHDQAGLILFGKRPRLALPPAAVDRMPIDERMAGPIDGNYTDIAAAIKLALASFPEGTGKRIVLVSDGNENLGNAEVQAALAKENGVQIDAVALAPGFKNESEVLIQAVEAPPVTAQGQRLPIRVLVRNATPDKVVDGLLTLTKSADGADQLVPIEDGPQVLDPGKPPRVRLLPGLNVFRFRDDVARPKKKEGEKDDQPADSAFAFRAVFAPTESRPVGGGVVTPGLPGDRPANNQAAAAVVTRGQRRVLLIDEPATGSKATQHGYLLATLAAAKIKVTRMPAEDLPAEKALLGVFLSNFDCVILANVPYERFTQDQAEMIRSSVYDQGCGLVMVGGPDAFGPGGYQGSPIEAALPVDCEIKALKAAGKGGLILIMHASEMADGNKWQKDIAKLAITRLGPADMVGVVQYGGLGNNGVHWHIPFQEVGEDRQRLLAKVDGMIPGDMPDFDPFLRASVDTLTDGKYALTVKHCILISDGDPQYAGPGQKAVKEMGEKGVTCTTVGVATHGGAEKSRLKAIAEGTKDGEGKKGNFYDVTNPNQLPAIYIKESRRVSQSFLFTDPFTPTLTGPAGSSDVLPPALPAPLPRLYGFVRTTMKQNVLAGMSLEGPTPYPDQRFPVLASWRYGLGKSVAFTSDARTQPGSPRKWWDRDWVGSDMYQKFWEQVINWAMREAERGRLTLTTEYKDGKVRVIADVRDDKDKPVGGLTLKGAVSLPGTLAPGEKPPAIEFRPKGGGLYEAEFTADEAGSYFLNVQALEPERRGDGAVVVGKDGTPQMMVFDAARAGVTVPYSPEFADLESNTPLLRRLAEATGGNFVTESDEDLDKLLKSGDVFREAPSTTRAILPFWFWMVFAAGLLLLFDVGVRRISVEPREVTTAATRVWGTLRHQKAAADDPHGLGRLLQRKAAVGEAIDRGRSARRFEPTAPTAEPAPLGADEYVTRTEALPPPPPPVRRPDQPPDEDPDDPLTRLKKAKERAKFKQPKRDEDEQR